MFEFLRLVLKDIRSKEWRFRFCFFILRSLPGEAGHYLRKRLLTKRFKHGGEDVRVNEGVQIRNIQNLSLGKSVSLGVDDFIQAGGGVEIGDNTILGPGVKIWTQNHIYKDPSRTVRSQGAEFKKVTIGSDVWVGANVFIMPGAEIGDGCVISAAAVVGGKKFKEYSIIAGNPARVIGFRNAPAAETTPTSSEA